MHEDLLEQVMVGFWEKDFDVLVCTTIVESGLDIPNANTLIVERADAFGLSQLHQLRGRVGRGRERAYAYFLYPTEKPLTETAYDRLSTIAQNTDLGSGMAVAMKDLEIRGAGNLLGGEQSGHIAGVGFDLYVRMVGEAVRDFREGRSADDGARADGDQGRAARRRASAARLRPVRAAPARGVPPARRGRHARRRRRRYAPSCATVTARRRCPSRTCSRSPRSASTCAATASATWGSPVSQVRFAPLELRESQQLRLARLFKGAVVKTATRQVLVPRPTDSGRLGGTPLRDVPLLDWAKALLDAVVGDSIGQAAAVASGVDGSGKAGR